MVTKCSLRHNFIDNSNQKNSVTKVVKEYVLIQEMSWRPLNMESFRHNLTEATKQKTYLTKPDALMMEMLCRPLNMK